MFTDETLTRIEKARQIIQQELPPNEGTDGTPCDNHHTLAAEAGAVRYYRGALSLQEARQALHQAEANFHRTKGEYAHKTVIRAWFQLYGVIIAAETEGDPDLTEEDYDIRELYLR